MSSPTEKQSLSDQVPPASLSTLPPELLTLIINEVAHLDHLKPLNKSHHVERTNHFLHFSESSRQDIWNLATTCKQMREATMERRLRLLKKKIWADVGMNLPEDMSYIAGSVQYLDLYDPKGAFPRSFIDYQPILAAILPHFTGLHGLRIPSFLPAEALSVGHLEYLEVMFLPMSEYPVIGEKVNIKPVKVDTFVLTELEDAIFPESKYAPHHDHGSTLCSGEVDRYKKRLDANLSGITGVTHLIIRAGGKCSALEEPRRLSQSLPFEILAAKPAFKGTKQLTVELRVDFEYDAEHDGQVSAVTNLAPSLAAISRSCERVNIIWNSTTSQGYDSLQIWPDCFMEEPGQYYSAYHQMGQQQSKATVPPGGYTVAYPGYLKALPALREIRIENWVASRYIKPTIEEALKHCFKPFQRRVAKIDPGQEKDIEEQTSAVTDGWKDALMAQVLADMSAEQRHYFIEEEDPLNYMLPGEYQDLQAGGIQGLLQAILSRLAGGGGQSEEDD